MSFDFMQVDYSMFKDAEFEFMHVSATADLTIMQERTEEVIRVAKSNMYLFNTNYYEEWSDLVYEADGISGDLYSVVEDLGSLYDEMEITGSLLVIDGFEVIEKMRGKGIGSMFLKQIIEDMRFLNIDTAALIPGHYEERERGISQR